VSLATDPPNFSKIRGLAFGALDPQDKIDSKGSFDKIDALASIILVFIIVCILFYFTG
jgi:SSS family solute:Na+ symporter